MASALDDLWPAVRRHLRAAVPDAAFGLWLEPLRPRTLSDHVLTLEAPDHVRRWASDRFSRTLDDAAAAVIGPGVRVDIVAAGAAPQAPGPATGRVTHEAPFNPKLTFDQFVIGDSNRFAHAAALAVAEMPGQAYNPLFVYGRPGLGKTHLLHSIANYVELFGAGLTVRLTTAEGFVNAFVAALQHGGIDAFKARFRHTDVLLIDDVQFLERKARTEEEFFHTFNALHETGAQLVLTSDRLPGDLAGLEDRLRARFEAGLVADVRSPDHATRLTILRKRAAHDRLVLADVAALDVVAERITDNVRVLEGALIRVVAFASLTGRAVDAALATEVLDGLYPVKRPSARSVAAVQRATCEAFGLTLDELVSPSRAVRVTWPRQVAMYLARELSGETLPAIGRAFGGRDHSTVMHACRRTLERMADDPAAYESVRRLTERLADPA